MIPTLVNVNRDYRDYRDSDPNHVPYRMYMMMWGTQNSNCCLRRGSAAMAWLITRYRAHPNRNQHKDTKKVKKANKANKKAKLETVESGAHTSASNKSPTARTPAAHLATLRAEVGILTKRAINEVRLRWLQGQPRWRHARLVRYVNEVVSPENTLLVAFSADPP